MQSNLMRFFILAISAVFVLGACWADNLVLPLDKAKDLCGVYSGQWSQYNPDGSLKSAWDDVIEGSNARIENGRAIITVVDKMSFTFPNKFPFIQKFTEGFFINSKDGSASDHFYEYDSGSLYIERQISPTTWSIQSQAKISSYSTLGITEDNAIVASDFAIKTVTFIGGVEVQHVTQTTTLVWRDVNGQIQTRQFVSLDGVHQRLH